MNIQSVPWLMVAVFTLILLILAVFIINSRSSRTKTISEELKQVTPQHKDRLEKTKRVKLIWLVFIGLLVFGLMVGFYFYEKFQEGGSSSGVSGSDNNSFFPLIPIWVAIFVPILANKKKHPEQKMNAKQQRVAIVVTLLAFIIVLAAVILTFFIN